MQELRCDGFAIMPCRPVARRFTGSTGCRRCHVQVRRGQLWPTGHGDCRGGRPPRGARRLGQCSACSRRSRPADHGSSATSTSATAWIASTRSSCRATWTRTIASRVPTRMMHGKMSIAASQAACPLTTLGPVEPILRDLGLTTRELLRRGARSTTPTGSSSSPPWRTTRERARHNAEKDAISRHRRAHRSGALIRRPPTPSPYAPPQPGGSEPLEREP
jgi:hypothetical protein